MKVKPTVRVWLTGIAISSVAGLTTLMPVHAHTSSHSGNTNSTQSENTVALCHLDVDGEFDLINMSLDMALEHLEYNDGHMLAVDSKCVTPQ